MTATKTFRRADPANFQNIPEELRRTPQWHCWKLYDGRKVPIDPLTGRVYPKGTKSEDMGTATFEQACACLVREKDVMGPGFRFKSNDPYCGMDWDRCRDPETGDIAEWAQESLAQFQHTYREVSASGTGAHAICRARIPKAVTHEEGPGVEMYFTGRYFAFTGQPLNGSPSIIADAQQQVNALFRQLTVNPATGENGSKPTVAKKIPHGRIDNWLTSQAGAYRRRGDNAEQIEKKLLIDYRERCEPPHSNEKRVREIARGVERYAVGTRAKHLEKITDADNADLLKDAEGENLRYVFEMKKWMVWDGRRWLIDEGQQARALMEKTMRARIADVVETGNAKQMAAASTCLDTYRLTNGLHEAEKKLGVGASELDTHPFLLTFENGTLNLKTMKLEDHNREHLITKMVHCNYDEGAECLKFIEFLYHAVGVEGLEYLQKLLGYSLTGDTSEKTFVVVWGVGDTGKTTFLEVMRKLLEEYAVLLQVDTLMDRHGGGDGSTQEDLASLRGMRIATTSELDQGRKLSIAVLKRIVQGQGKITACAKYQKKIEFYETHKLWFDTNHLPTIPVDEQAVWNRVAVVVFKNPVEKEKQDKQLAAKLVKEEAEGIIAWMVKGERLRQEHGIGKVPESFSVEKEKWQKKMDVLQQFLEECCDRDAKLREKPDVLYKGYVAWVGNPEHAMGRKTFTQRLAKHGILLDSSRRYYQGVSLVKDTEEPAQTTFLEEGKL